MFAGFEEFAGTACIRVTPWFSTVKKVEEWEKKNKVTSDFVSKVSNWVEMEWRSHLDWQGEPVNG